MGGRTISTSETRIEAFRIQSSAYGVTIPLVWGVTRLAGNMLWYGGFKAVPHTQSQGGKGGVKVQNTTYSYTASVMMGLCHGRITNVPRVWKGKAVSSGGVTGAQMVTASEDYTPPGSGAMTYTTAHASTFGAMSYIVAGAHLDFPAFTRMLQPGLDYTVAAGVVTVLRDEWRGIVLRIVYQYTTVTPSTLALSDLGLTFIAGEIGQAAWSGLASFGTQSIGYSGLACVAGADYDLGTGAQIDLHSFEVVAPLAYHLGASVPDVDPSLVLRSALSNALAGANFPSAYLDAWSAWSDYAVASGLLVSPALTTQTRAAEIVERAGEFTNTRPVWVGGKLKMVPRADSAVTGNGRTYTPSVTPVYNLDDNCYTPRDGSSPVQVKLKSPADRYNHVRVQYSSRTLDYNPDIAEAKDQADIDTNGLRSMPVVDAREWICDGAVARQIAQLLLQRSLHVQREFAYGLPWHYALLEPADIVTLSDTTLQLASTGVCIIEIEEGPDGDLAFVAEDFPAGTGGAAVYPSQAPAGFLHDYNAAPGNADTPLVFEAPAERAITGLAIAVAVKGSGTYWGGAQIWVSQDGTNYKQIGTVYGPARAGTLSAAVTSGATSVPVTGLGSAQLGSGSAADAAAFNTLCYIGGANPEYIGYQTATLTGAGAYTLGGVVRAGYRTAAAAHSSGDVFVRVDDRVVFSEDLDRSMVGKTVSIKVCSFNIFGAKQQSLADVSATNYTITGNMLALRTRLATDELAIKAATDVRTVALSATSVTGYYRSYNAPGPIVFPVSNTWTTIATDTFTPTVTGEAEITVNGSATFIPGSHGVTFDHAATAYSLAYTVNGGAETGVTFVDQTGTVGTTFTVPLNFTRRVSVTGGVSVTLAIRAQKAFDDDAMTVSAGEFRITVIYR